MLIDREKLYADIGRRIKQAREGHQPKLTQEQLAKRLGVKRTSITNIENGTQRATLFFLYAIALDLNIPLKNLLPAVDDAEILSAEKGQTPEDQRLSKRQRAQVNSFVDKVSKEN